MKSIHFPAPIADDAIRAILSGNKTVTRRVVKPQPYKVIQQENSLCWCGHFISEDGKVQVDKLPYRHGDILYVRETFCKCCLNENYRKGHIDFCYKASITSQIYGCIDHYSGGDGCKWNPSIHMPIEAARIFLRVMNVRVERLQDIDDDGVVSEGLKIGDPFDEIWNRTIKRADRARYGWEANPWVWVIEFERIERTKA